ncbi:M17 family metallopeptidase [Flavobacterium sp. CLA17]|uniref:leucyl aminopeptidase family protein n=1 Tax=Flavobacterium sp. CLA17 TaxID=2724135 RepID=UPI0014909EF5|nr:leucyl aminopeptidase [Flavobacterium sp. CLA17]QSB29274.1 leucyl aminopeptidase [Flavobacterium sp. CLA17]
MLPDYLHVELRSYLRKQNIPADADHIAIMASREQAARYDFQKTLDRNIKRAFSKNEVTMITSLGDKRSFIIIIPKKDAESIRLAGALIYETLDKEQSQSAVFSGLDELQPKDRYVLLEGMLLSSYKFTKYKTAQQKSVFKVYVRNRSFSKEKIKELSLLVQCISFTKTLVNEPPNYMDALKFSQKAKEAALLFGFEAQILRIKEIEELKMGGLLAVNKGSDTPPTFNVLTYKPDGAVNARPLVLIGKGVMFDTGGYSLKAAGAMSGMKCDMAGGAAVLGTLAAIAGNKLPYYVIGLIPATDNKISSEAMVTDDIITVMDGTTIEVDNTDAEGRLLLADALTYARRFDPELVFTVATLTGASAAITGSFGIAMFGNEQQQMDALKITGEEVYERLLELPLWKEYAALLKSDIADFRNIGGPVGGASTAAKFLEHFTHFPWLHLDIAGAAFLKEAAGYRQKGATGVPVRLLYSFIETKCNVLSCKVHF